MSSRRDERIEDLSPAQRRVMLSLILFRWSILIGLLVFCIVPSLRFHNWLVVAFALLMAQSIGMRVLHAHLRHSRESRSQP